MYISWETLLSTFTYVRNLVNELLLTKIFYEMIVRLNARHSSYRMFKSSMVFCELQKVCQHIYLPICPNPLSPYHLQHTNKHALQKFIIIKKTSRLFILLFTDKKWPNTLWKRHPIMKFMLFSWRAMCKWFTDE